MYQRRSEEEPPRGSQPVGVEYDLDESKLLLSACNTVAGEIRFKIQEEGRALYT